MDDDYQRPEGRLLRQRLDVSKLSTRQAAKDMGISDARLRQIINGYQPAGRGQKIEVVAPASTLARAAFVLGVGGEELRAAGRPDAADELEEYQSFGTLADAGTRDSAAVAELTEYLKTGPDPLLPAPSSAMFIFSDTQLVEEVGRRLDSRAKRIQDLAGVTAILERGRKRLPSLSEERERRRSNMSEMASDAARNEDED